MVPEDVIGGECGGSLRRKTRQFTPRRRARRPLSSQNQRPERTRWPRRTPSSKALNTLDKFFRSLSETAFGHCVPVVDTGTQSSPSSFAKRVTGKTVVRKGELGCPRVLFIWTLRICLIFFESQSAIHRTTVCEMDKVPLSSTSNANQVPLGD